jgi:hypothetical protein
MLATCDRAFLWCALLTVWLGAISSAGATIEIVGESQATFAWTPSDGAVTGYYVYVSRDGTPPALHSRVFDANLQTIQSRFGRTIQVSVAAFDDQGNLGTRSDLSEEVHFVEAAAPTPLATATPLPTSTPIPTPIPTPSTVTTPIDETPAEHDPLTGDTPDSDRDLLPSAGRAAAYDFNGDGVSDILIRNATTGELEVWQLSGSRIADVIPLPMTDPRWLAAGAADFDFDGVTDILWYDPDHSRGRIWLMGNFAGDGEFDLPLPAGWVVEGAGDFNGDGRGEIAIWNQSSRIEIWGLRKKLVRFAQISIRQRRVIVGFGDIDGDGDDDIIVQDYHKRKIEASLMSADLSATYVLLDKQRAARRGVIDSADYDGDGQSDLLWRELALKDQGAAGVWLLTSSLGLGDGSLDLNLGVDQAVVGSADYDGDGSADLLVFDRSTRELTLWLMGGSGALSFESLGTLAPGWLPAGFDTDDSAQLQ